jgi:uncharacterized metal-binding protein
MSKKVYVIPCSGIGKVFGSICRRAAYIVTEELQPEKSALECLPLIVVGKQEVVDELKNNKVITLDGCPALCAFHDVSQVVGPPDANFLSTSVVKEYRDLKPEKTIYPMGENAMKLSQIFAEEIAQKVEELCEE